MYVSGIQALKTDLNFIEVLYKGVNFCCLGG